MLRACAATWLLKNEQRKVADVHVSGVTSTKALDTPFTPAPLRPRPQLVPPTSPVGRTTAKGVAQVLWRTPARTHTQIRDRAAAQQGSSAAHKGSSAYELAAHRGSSAYERAAQKASAHERAAHKASAHEPATRPRSMGQIASDAAWARAAQREQKRPERPPSNWDIPDLDALSVVEDDRMSQHGIELSDYAPPSSEGSVFDLQSLASGNSLSSCCGSGQSKKSQGSSLSRSSVDRHDMAQMAEDLKSNYDKATVAQAATMSQQANEPQELRTQLEENNRRQVDYSEGADGVEPWVAEAVLEDDLRVTHLW